MKRTILVPIKHTAKALAYGIAGAMIVLIAVLIAQLEDRPDLKVWHEAQLEAEFTTHTPVHSFDDYLALETRLFDQLQERISDRIDPADRRQINRYHKGSLSDPARWTPNWNRSFELAADAPVAGILLLHGMSDSPYSLRGIGQQLHAAGAWVIGLRLPGHGTAPSGLIEVRWQDMAAAVRLAMTHLRDMTGDRPLYITGYSTGGALAVNYALLSLEDSTLPPVKGLVMISPAIGVTRLATFAVWQARLGNLLGLDKLAWNDIQPEYDPFKYGSFAVNAGDQVYRLTSEIQKRLGRLSTTEYMRRFPPVLAFQSVVDATVSARAVITAFFERLPTGGPNELVLFDINRSTEIEQVLTKDPGPKIAELFANVQLPFILSLVTNANQDSLQVVVRRKMPGDAVIQETPTNMIWPQELYSLSHVSLPFPYDDPLYGMHGTEPSPGIQIGNAALRGEKGVLQIPAATMLRLRSNPFYPYLQQRLLEFLHLAGEPSLESG